MYKGPYIHDEYVAALEDVVVHLMLVCLLECFRRSTHKITYVDSHAAAGLYRLSRSKKFHREAIAATTDRFYRSIATSPSSQSFRRLLIRLNRGSRSLSTYPGSPSIAHELLPRQTSFVLSERREPIYRRLKSLSESWRNTRVYRGDGYSIVAELLSNRSSALRHIIYIDPSYELQQDAPSDFDRIGKLVREQVASHDSVTVAVTYPAATESDVRRFRDFLAQLPKAINRDVAYAYLRYESKPKLLRGAGFLVINAPAGFRLRARPALFELNKRLCLVGAKYGIFARSK